MFFQVHTYPYAMCTHHFDSPRKYSSCVACVLMPIKWTMFRPYAICYVVTKWKNHAHFDSPSKYSSCIACILMPIKGTMFCSYTICYIVTKWKNYTLYCDLCLLFLLVYRYAEQRNTDKGQFISICAQYMIQLRLLFCQIATLQGPKL